MFGAIDTFPRCLPAIAARRNEAFVIPPTAVKFLYSRLYKDLFIMADPNTQRHIAGVPEYVLIQLYSHNMFVLKRVKRTSFCHFILIVSLQLSKRGGGGNAQGLEAGE
jgi:hypothetical protein